MCVRQSVSVYTSVTNSYMGNAQMKIECVQTARANIGLSWCIPKPQIERAIKTPFTHTHRLESRLNDAHVQLIGR